MPAGGALLFRACPAYGGAPAMYIRGIVDCSTSLGFSYPSLLPASARAPGNGLRGMCLARLPTRNLHRGVVERPLTPSEYSEYLRRIKIIVSKRLRMGGNGASRVYGPVHALELARAARMAHALCVERGRFYICASGKDGVAGAIARYPRDSPVLVTGHAGTVMVVLPLYMLR